MPHRLPDATHVAVGTKQTLKALQSGSVQVIYVAEDADDRVVAPVTTLAETSGVELIKVESMAQLGRLCRIEVGAATAAVLNS